MSIPNASGTPSHPKEWWEEVSLHDVTGCTTTVKKFINDPETADVSQLPLALPLFILCGGDHSWLVKNIKNVTDRVCKESKEDLEHTKALARVRNWLERLKAIYGDLLLRVPDSYGEDVTKVRESVRDGVIECKLTLIKIQAPKRSPFK